MMMILVIYKKKKISCKRKLQRNLDVHIINENFKFNVLNARSFSFVIFVIINQWIIKSIIMKLNLLSVFVVTKFKMYLKIVQNVKSNLLNIIVKFVIYLTMISKIRNNIIAINVNFVE